MRLQVVELGQNEFVVGIADGGVEVQPYELECGSYLGEFAVFVGQQQPRLGELALRVPPHRVVVEMADHPHDPAWLGHADHRRQFGAGRRRGRADKDRPRRARLGGGGDLDSDLDRHLRAALETRRSRGLGRADRRSVDGDLSSVGRADRARAVVDEPDSDELQRSSYRAMEEVSRVNAADPHVLMLAWRRAQVTSRLPGRQPPLFYRPAAIAGLLLAAFLKEQVIAVGSPGVQYAIAPVRARRHQFFAVPDTGLGQSFLCKLQIAHAELPGENLVRTRGREIFPPLDAELHLAVTKRQEVWILRTFVSDLETEAHVEVALGLQVTDEQDRNDPAEQCRHSGTSYRPWVTQVTFWRQLLPAVRGKCAGRPGIRDLETGSSG